MSFFFAFLNNYVIMYLRNAGVTYRYGIGYLADFDGFVHLHCVQHSTTVTTGIFQFICRCRLSVWRQLPKLISAGPTPVTCSTKNTRNGFNHFVCFLYILIHCNAFINSRLFIIIDDFHQFLAISNSL